MTKMVDDGDNDGGDDGDDDGDDDGNDDDGDDDDGNNDGGNLLWRRADNAACTKAFPASAVAATVSPLRTFRPVEKNAVRKGSVWQ